MTPSPPLGGEGWGEGGVASTTTPSPSLSPKGERGEERDPLSPAWGRGEKNVTPSPPLGGEGWGEGEVASATTPSPSLSPKGERGEG
jgi:hypothetical protein